jgi:phosphatidylglycerophosphate synthase
MLSVFKPAVEKSLRPVAYTLRNVNPNLITSVGLIFPVLFFIFVLHEAYVWALVMLILTATDMLDGLVARAQSKVTAFGGFFDSTVDRFSDFVVLVVFGFANIVSWEVTLTLVLLSYLISYIRSRTELASKATLVANVGIIERTERLLIIFVGLAVYAIWPSATFAGLNLMTCAFVVLTVLSAITVAQRFVFAYRKL